MFHQMGEAFSGMMIPLKIAVIVKSQENFNTIETIQSVADFLGVLQPLSRRALLMKPEGERHYKYFTLWTLANLGSIREPYLDSFILDQQNRQYRVMSQFDWSQAGYWECDLKQSPTVQSVAAINP